LNAGWSALPKLDRKIAEGRAAGILGSGPFRGPWLGSLYVRVIEPPARIRFPAPKRFRPRQAPPSGDVVPRLLALQDELSARARASDGLDVGAIRLSSPITRRFKMSLGQWFAFLAAHERRHIWQAGNVRKALNARDQRAGASAR
jgi:DinB superfamily